MRFNLSTLMLAVPAAGLACMGWKLAQWMIEYESGEIELMVVALLAISSLLMIALGIIAGRRVIAWAAGGFFASIALLLAIWGPPEPPKLWCLVPLFGAPLGLFSGSLRFAWEKDRSIALRQSFLLPAFLMAGWMLAVFTS